MTAMPHPRTLAPAVPVPSIPAAAALPAAEICWQAVVERDRAFDGRFWFGVHTTGVFCRPSCGARRPLRANVTFHPSAAHAEAAGLRACKRCRPLEATAGAGPSAAVAAACRLLDAADGESRPSLERIARRVGLTASTLTRRFQKELGVGPRDWLAARKHRRLRAALRAGHSIGDAIYGAGYGSSSRVYERSDRTLGMTPATYRKGGLGARIAWTAADTALGRVLVAATEKGICAVFLGADDRALEAELRRDFPAAELHRDDTALAPRVESVLARFAGRRSGAIDAADAPLDIAATAFQWKVWKALTEIPPGETRSYGEIAARIGAPGAARAVGRACATNQVAVVVPCHRAVGASGALTGYRWGVERKRRLLDEERKRAAAG